MLQRYSIFDVLEFGSIVAHDSIEGIVVTFNKNTFSSWTYVGQGCFVGGTKCLVHEIPRGEDCTDYDMVLEVGRDFLKEVISRDDESNEPSNS